MARKIIVTLPDGEAPVLVETAVEDEAQLQTLLKENPDLLPIEEFGLTGPLMIVGEETTLPSGAIDLVVITRGGRMVIVEFKTGPQNADFRRALAQLLDYGSDVWQMSLESFESAVAVRYFTSDRCRDHRVKGVRSLEEAARRTWDNLSDEEWWALRDRLTQQLASGAFEYVLAAQRFTDPTLQTTEYLNTVSRGPHFYAVEVVHFVGDRVSAFESRTALKPTQRTPNAAAVADESSFLGSIDDPEYRDALGRLLDAVKGLDLRIDWGNVGCSIRLPTPCRAEPVSIAWLFPEGRSGWMGLTDFNMGYDPWTVKQVPEAQPVLDRYAKAVSELPDVSRARPQSIMAYHVGPAQVVELHARIIELLAQAVSEVTA